MIPKVTNLPSHFGIPELFLDRKSTRLNSSHLGISYAVFCLKKKKRDTHHNGLTSGMIGMREWYAQNRSCPYSEVTSTIAPMVISEITRGRDGRTRRQSNVTV